MNNTVTGFWQAIEITDDVRCYHEQAELVFECCLRDGSDWTLYKVCLVCGNLFQPDVK